MKGEIMKNIGHLIIICVKRGLLLGALIAFLVGRGDLFALVVFLLGVEVIATIEDLRLEITRLHNSVVECRPDAADVEGSSPSASTNASEETLEAPR
jgi:hypothetical protein